MSEKTTLRTTDISCRVLETLEINGKTGISEIASELGHSKSTIYDHLVTLRRNQFVVQEGDEYRLSLRFVAMSQRVKTQRCNYPIVREAVDELAEKTGEQAQFGSEDCGLLFEVYRATGNPDLGGRFYPEIERPLHCTALGKTILASMEQERVDEIIERRGLKKQTENTITDYDELMTELETIRKQQFAIDDQELTKGLQCVAAPITSDSGVIGAIGVSGPVSKLESSRLTDDLATEVQRVANVIEINSMFSE